jgi:hypothetical protein
MLASIGDGRNRERPAFGGIDPQVIYHPAF